MQLAVQGSQAWSYPVSATLTLLQEKWSKNDAQAVVDRLRTEAFLRGIVEVLTVAGIA